MLEGRLLWKIVGLVVIYDGKFRAVTECAIKRTRMGIGAIRGVQDGRLYGFGCSVRI